jgi:hypothetical protein
LSASQGGHCQEGALSDPEELGVLSTGDREALMFHETTVPPAQNQAIDIAVAPGHRRRLSRRVGSKLRNDQVQGAVVSEGLDGARA